MSSHIIEKYKISKGKILGQFFTKTSAVEKLLGVLSQFKQYNHNIKILEPSFGTSNFIKILRAEGYKNIDGCEIDPNLTDSPMDFFNYPFSNKYDLIIGNPPFSKYNIKESYCYIQDLFNKLCPPSVYLSEALLKRDKEKIENLFILKSIKHLKNENSSIAFILPISFFIKNKNKLVKQELLKKFSTIIIFQDAEVWFDYHIPCCFAIFTTIEKFSNKIILYYRNKQSHKEILRIDNIFEELIPEVFYNKKLGLFHNHIGIALKEFLSTEKTSYKKSFQENNVSAKNILEKNRIPSRANVEDFKLAVVRVGNASVGRCGLINTKKDILNDMFYVLDFANNYTKNKNIKERICREINKHQNYFKSITCRVGSKSIKKDDILNFKANL